MTSDECYHTAAALDDTITTMTREEQAQHDDTTTNTHHLTRQAVARWLDSSDRRSACSRDVVKP
jgi:hypothetical protein